MKIGAAKKQPAILDPKKLDHDLGQAFPFFVMTLSYCLNKSI